MKAVLRVILGLASTALGLYCLIGGNPAWMVSLGFENWILPTLILIPGVSLLVVALIVGLPRRPNEVRAPETQA